MKKLKGFTLLEVIVVIGIIGILLTIAIPSFNKVSAEAHMKKLQAEAIAVESALDTYKLVYGSLPVEGNMTRAEVLDIADRVYNTDGMEFDLSNEQTYSDIDEVEIKEFVDINVDSKNFIADPNGEVFFLDPVTNNRVTDNSPLANMAEVTHADLSKLKSESLLKDGSARLNTGYEPSANYDIATKGYTDTVRSEILYEVNKPLEEVVDWNIPVVPGRYHSAPAIPNAPTSDADYNWYGVISDSNGFITQTLRDQENRVTYTRTKDGAADWTAWNQVLDSSDYQELFQFVVDGKNNIETAIIDKDGTVSKAGVVPTFAELQHGVETIPTYGTSTMMPLYRHGEYFTPLTGFDVYTDEEEHTVGTQHAETHSYATFNADNIFVLGDYVNHRWKWASTWYNTELTGKAWAVSKETVDLTDYKYIAFELDPDNWTNVGVTPTASNPCRTSAGKGFVYVGGGDSLGAWRMTRHVEFIDISSCTGDYNITITANSQAGMYASDGRITVYGIWLQKELTP